MLQIAETSPPFHFTDSLRTTEDLPASITYTGKLSKNGKIKARMMKNVEWKEIKEVREVAHKSPSLYVTQKIRKTL